MADGRAFEAFDVFECALVVGRHWNAQEGVNGGHVDDLADAVARYDAASPDVGDEPSAVRSAREVLRRWKREGVCPEIAKTVHACAWTCLDCKQQVPPTVESDGEKLHVRCRRLP